MKSSNAPIRCPTVWRLTRFTTSAHTANLIGDALQSGMVGVNSIAVSTPETQFGGIKKSGYGSEGGFKDLQAQLNTKFISQA